MVKEEKNEFLKNLNYQINIHDTFFKKIPLFHEQLNTLNFKITLKESMNNLKRSYETERRRRVYSSIVSELEDMIKKKRNQN